jgi:hypothetical protein
MSTELRVVREEGEDCRGGDGVPTTPAAGGDAYPALQIAKPELPLQINLFTREVEPLRLEIVEPPQEREGEEVEVDDGISVIKSENLSQIIGSGHGCFLSKKSERVVVKRAGREGSLSIPDVPNQRGDSELAWHWLIE